MEILLNKFKEYLIAEKISKITIKNYFSDIRKFASWFERTYQKEFHPLLITPNTIEAYKTQISTTSSDDSSYAAKSIKRYTSSLRKLFSFLHASGAIPMNPLQMTHEEQIQPDPWRIKDFKHFLYNDKASPLTIKNYILDIRQFLNWFEKVRESSNSAQLSTEPFNLLDSELISEYKNRMLNEAGFSPTSINRKLSSLRRYIAWLNQKGLIKNDIQINDLNVMRFTSVLPVDNPPQAEELPSNADLEALTALQRQQSQSKKQEQNTYSQFPPLRFIQKTVKLSNASFDFLILTPITKIIEASNYNLWKFKGRKVFAPSQALINNHEIKTPTKIASNSNRMTRSAKLPQALKEFMGMGLSPRLEAKKIRGIPKSVYAPLKISTKNFSFPKKILFYIRHKRPKWYIKYHSYPIVQYFHFGIFLIFMTSVGFGMYHSFFEKPNSGKPVLAALATSPPRILSFRGRITDSSNNPLTAATNLRFAIYNSSTSSGSALLWEETQHLSPDQEGVFSASLGKKNIINQSIFTNNPKLFLGITVETDEELKPRQQLATTSYATNSDTLQGLSPITQADAGTNNVILALDSSGDLTIGDNASPTFQAIGGEFTLSGKVLTLTTAPGSNTNVQLSPDGSGIIDLQKPLQNTTDNNSIGIPSGAVEVEDLFAINATSSTNAAITIIQNGSGGLISASSGGSAKFAVSNTGDGIFAGRLTISGDSLNTSATTFYLANTNATTLYLGGAATSLAIGASSGTTTINNALSALNLITANGGLTIPSGKSLNIEGSINSNLIASSSAKYDLGSTNSYWRNAYIENVFASPTATTSGFWQRNNGALASTNMSDDILIGGNASNSSTFHIFASTGNASTSGNFTFNSAGTIQTTNNQTLTIGGNTTGNIILSPQNGSGSVGIGTTSPLATLDVRGNTNSPALLVQNSGGGDLLTASSSGTTKLRIANNGDVTIIGSVATCTLGNGTSGTSCSASDERLKTDIASLSDSSGLEALKQLNPVSYNWNSQMKENGATDARQYGFIAQEVARVFPNLVNQDNNSGYFKLDYQGLFAPIVKAIQELNNKIERSTSTITDNISIGGQTINEYIKSTLNQALNDAQATFFPTKVVSPIGEIGTLKTNLISPLASESAIVVNGNLEIQGDASVSGTLRVKKIIADEIEAKSITTSTISATYITNITNIYNSIGTASGSAEQIATPSATPVLTPQTTQNASDSGHQSIEQSNLSDSQSSQSTPILQTNFANISSLSGQISNAQTLTSEFGKFTQGLISLGPTSLAETSINGDLSIGRNFIINENSLNTIGTDLSIQPLRQGNISFMGKAVIIDTEGNLNVNGNSLFAKNVTVKGKLAANIIIPVPNNDLIVELSGTKSNGESPKFEIKNSSGSGVLAINHLGDLIASGSGQFNKIAANALSVVRGAQADTSFTETIASSSAGASVITANETERTIYSPYVTQDSLIYVTATSNTKGQTPYVARQVAEDPQKGSKGSFTVQIPSRLTTDIKFNWWILN